MGNTFRTQEALYKTRNRQYLNYANSDLSEGRNVKQ